MKIFINHKQLSQARLDAWEKKHTLQALKNLHQPAEKTDDLPSLRAQLQTAKDTFSYEEVIKLLRPKLALGFCVMNILARASRLRRLRHKTKYATAVLFIEGLYVEDFVTVAESFTSSDTPEIRRINNNVNPEHYALISRGTVFEVIEKAGNCPVPLQFFIEFYENDAVETSVGKGSILTSTRDASYPYESAGIARLKNGVIVGGIRHQFKNTAAGLEAKTLVEFPALCPSYIVRDHCLHLALEWKNWLLAAKEIAAQKHARNPHNS